MRMSIAYLYTDLGGIRFTKKTFPGIFIQVIQSNNKVKNLQYEILRGPFNEKSYSPTIT